MFWYFRIGFMVCKCFMDCLQTFLIEIYCFEVFLMIFRIKMSSKRNNSLQKVVRMSKMTKLQKNFISNKHTFDRREVMNSPNKRKVKKEKSSKQINIDTNDLEDRRKSKSRKNITVERELPNKTFDARLMYRTAKKDQLKKMNFHKYVSKTGRREHTSGSKGRGLTVDGDEGSKKLPPLRGRDITKSYDYEDNGILRERSEDILPNEVPWHHPNRSIRTNKIVNLYEGSMMELLATSTQGSGLIRNNKHVISHRPYDKKISARNSGYIDPNEREKIYIKRHLLKTRGVTALTKSVNIDTSTAITLINDIEKKKTMKDAKKLENIDLRRLIQKTNKDFKIALYKLCKATHDMKPKSLIINTPTEFEVIDTIPTLFKVSLEGLKPPITLNITYLSAVKDLIVYYSWKNYDPDKEDHDGAYKNPNRIYLNNKMKGNIRPGCKAYFSLHSYKGNFVRITARPNKEKANMSQNLVQENKEYAMINHGSAFDAKMADSMIDTIQEMKSTNEVYIPEVNVEPKLQSLANDPLHFQAFSMVIDKVRERMKKNKLKLQGNNFMKKNIALIKHWHEYKNEKREKVGFYHSNIENVQKKRDLILKLKREKKGIQVKEKEKLKEEERQIRKQQNLANSWYLLLAQSKMKQHISTINNLFQSKMYEIRVEERKAFIKWRLRFVTSLYLKKRGETVEVRNFRDIKKCMNFAHVMKEVKSSTAAKTIKMFLEDRISLKSLRTKTISTHFRLTRLARFCKKNYEENEKKRDKLDFEWRMAQGTLITKFSTDGSEKALAKEQKLINFDPDFKREILTEYLDRCKLRHANMFNKWRVHNEGKRIVGNASGLVDTGIFMITQGDQNPEEERIKSLRSLGYYRGDKKTLNESLKRLTTMTHGDDKSKNIQALPRTITDKEIFSDDSELSEGGYDQTKFESEAIEYLEGLLKVEAPPVLIYIPTEKVMRQLILRNL
ncbi:unnamed protein product [Moneuplotes crassus]|uniref:Uncharacterized protein n=1 Tax=Euplotes crassus TaxID=5936 RepID=A0AAD1URQ9_EUPCR|nr:unnamed protein product [Moneuplotes crassus]